MIQCKKSALIMTMKKLSSCNTEVVKEIAISNCETEDDEKLAVKDMTMGNSKIWVCFVEAGRDLSAHTCIFFNDR